MAHPYLIIIKLFSTIKNQIKLSSSKNIKTNKNSITPMTTKN